MPVISPKVTVLTAAGTTMSDFFAALKAHFSSAPSDAKFDYFAGSSPSNDGFTLKPKDTANNYWQLNFRRTGTTKAKLMIDPGASITSPGTSGSDPAGASVKSSAEVEAWDIGSPFSSVGVKFVVIELKDALFIVNIDSGATPSYTPTAVHAGKIYVPFFSNSVTSGDGQGDNYADGLGILGGYPTWGTNSSNSLLSSYYPNTARSTARAWEGTSQGNGWHVPKAGCQVSSTQDGRINGKRRMRPVDVSLDDVDGSSDALIGYTKYLLFAGDPSSGQYPGTRDESATDAWIRVHSSSATTNQLIPWDLTTTPPF